MLLNALTDGGDRVRNAIQSASHSTGAEFDYLLRTAIRESALDPSAKAATSSARGLYQFIESTWLAMVKEDGPKYGLGLQAAQIEHDGNGRYFVRDRAARAQILKLRENPEIASLMAGALAERNAVEIAPALGRKPTAGELYAAHFLGAGGARRLFALAGSRPDAPAAATFPEAARANRSIFYRPDGAARSAREVYAVLTARHDRLPLQPTLTAQANAPAPPMPQARPVPVSGPSPLQASAVAELGNRLQAEAANSGEAARVQQVIFDHPVNPVRTAFAAEAEPVFRSLFRSDAAAPSPVAPLVQEIWGDLEAAEAWLEASAHAAAEGRQIAAHSVASVPRVAEPVHTVQAPLDLRQFVQPLHALRPRHGAI